MKIKNDDSDSTAPDVAQVEAGEWLCNVVNYLPASTNVKEMEINHSQMCTEILEYTDEFKSFVCCLSSLNLLHWDEIVETDAVETLAYFLDAVYTEFIQKAEGGVLYYQIETDEEIINFLNQ
jgi:hypothetical protein